MCKHNISPYLIIRGDIYDDIYSIHEDDEYVSEYYDEYDNEYVSEYYDEYDSEYYDEYDDEYEKCNECSTENITEDIRFNLLIEGIYTMYLNIEETNNLSMEKNNKKTKKFNLLNKIKKIIKISSNAFRK